MKKSILLRWVHADCDALGQAFSHVAPDAGITGAAGEFAPTVVTVIREIGTMYDAVAALKTVYDVDNSRFTLSHVLSDPLRDPDSPEFVAVLAHSMDNETFGYTCQLLLSVLTRHRYMARSDAEVAVERWVRNHRFPPTPKVQQARRASTPHRQIKVGDLVILTDGPHSGMRVVVMRDLGKSMEVRLIDSTDTFLVNTLNVRHPTPMVIKTTSDGGLTLSKE